MVRWYALQMWLQFFQHNCISAASALTYTTLFAVVPVMTVTYLIFSLLPEYADVGKQIQQFIFQNFVPGSSDLVQDKLAEFADRAGQLTTVGIFIVFGTVFMLLITIEKTFNTIWHVPEPRKGLQRFLLYWGVLSLGPAAIIAGIVSSVYITSLPLVSETEVFGLRELFIDYSRSIVAIGGFTILYYAVPNCHVPLKHAVVGGIVTMIVFQIAFDVFGQMSKGFSYDAIYGTFAALPVFLLWLYFVWVIVLCGAIFVRSLSLSKDDDETREPLVIKTARVIKLLHEAHLSGEVVTDKDIGQTVLLNQSEHDRVFEVLQELKLLGQTEGEHWMLGRNLKSVTLWDLYQRLPEGLDVERLRNIKDLPAIVDPLMAITQFGSNEMSVSLDRVFTGA